MLLQLRVDGLGEAGRGETHDLRALEMEVLFQLRLGVVLHHRVMREIFQDLRAAVLGEVVRDENEMQLALAATQRVTAHEQRPRAEHEWEKAARGTDQRIFPWGNHTDVTLRTNGPGTKDGFQVTAPVGSFPLDVSPYGAFDMAGNVSEMVIDKVIYFHYFGNADSGNTFTPYTYSMTKGGNWSYSSLFVYDFGGGSGGDSSVGFRCARDANP